MTNYGLRQNHRKIIGKTKKLAFCVPYSVPGRYKGVVIIYGEGGKWEGGKRNFTLINRGGGQKSFNAEKGGGVKKGFELKYHV